MNYERPSIYKLVTVSVKEPLLTRYGTFEQFAEYQGQTFEVITRQPVNTGNRRLYLKYSIVNDRYYLTK